MKKTSNLLLGWLPVLLFAIAFSGSPVITSGQSDFCAHDDYMNDLKAKDSLAFYGAERAFDKEIQNFRQTHPGPNYLPNPIPSESLIGGSGCPDAKYILPVVIHVIYDSTVPASNIDINQVFNQLEVLNKAFRNELSTVPGDTSVNTGIQFCLAKKKPDGTSFNGVTWTKSNLGKHKRNDLDKIVNLIYYPPDEYINIYVVTEILDTSGSSSSILGYATFPYGLPQNEGIVVEYDWFGDNATYGTPLNSIAEGKVLVHEMGHYLGVFHPFRNGCSGMTAGDCGTDGDKCCDVPPVGQQITSCSTVNTCNETYNGDLPDQKENYMDYTLPSCKNTFTAHQTEIMYTVLEGKRSGLWQVQNINNLELSCCLHSAQFTTPDLICKTDEAELTALSYTSGTYEWELYDAGASTLVNSSTQSSNVWTINPTPPEGIYDIKLIITVGGELFQLFKPSALTVVSCDSLIPSTQGSWYFGEYAGVKFYNDGVFRDVAPYKNHLGFMVQHNAPEGTISVSDSLGNLLFYAGNKDGIPSNSTIYVWDKEYSVMENNPIMGSNTAVQGLLSLPYHSDASRYHLISTTSGNVYHYIVDLDSGDSTYGAIIKIPGDTIVLDSFNNNILCHEGISAIPQCGDSSYWILISGRHDSYPNNSVINVMVANESGLHWVKKYIIPHQLDYQSSIKVAPNGNLFSLDVDIYSFDKITGEIELIYHDASPYLYHCYGASFSPDSRYLYRTDYYLDQNQVSYPQAHNFFLYQFDPYAVDIGATRREISKRYYNESIQIGPNNKLYTGNQYQTYLSVINSPNTRVVNGNECDLENIGVILQRNGVGGISMAALPNMVDANYEIEPNIDFNIAYQSCGIIELFPDQCCASDYKWLFGDGDTSNERSPSHTYQDTGTFTIQLIIGADTTSKTVEFGIDAQEVSINGPLIVCDSSQLYDYYVETDPNGNHTFTWILDNYKEAITVSQDYLQVKWGLNGSAKVIVTDIETGCVDSSSISVTFVNTIASNSITSDQSICDTTAISLTGSTPTGGNGTFTYQWYKTDETGIYYLMSGETGKDLSSNTAAFTTKYYRQVLSDGCINPSNEVTVTMLGALNEVSLTDALCYSGDRIYLDGNDLTGGPFVTYQWQFRDTQSSSWTSIQLSGEDLDTQQISFARYYRRKATYTNPSCETISDSILVTPEIYFLEHPKEDTMCTEFGEFSFSVKVHKPNSHTITYFWQNKDADSTNWPKAVRGSDTYASSGSQFDGLDLDTFRCYISTQCGLIYSNTAVLRVVNSAPGISSHPSNRSFYIEDTMDLTSTPSGSWSSVFWQVKPKGSLNWSNVPNSDSTTLILPGADLCDDSSQYRMAVKNICGTTYSNPAWVTVVDYSDLWMRDSKKDTGSEPNTNVTDSTITYDLFASPDLWNCYSGPTCTSPENAEYDTTKFNYVRVKVRNRGTLTSRLGRLRVYWTMASTGEIWDKSWTENDNNRFVNSYYGGEITKDSIHLIDTLVVGDSVIYTFAWNPPNPDLFLEDGKYHLEDKSAICLLARIEHCDDYPHAMTYPEQFNINIKDNVKKNNNIVTRNIWVFNNVPGQPGGNVSVGIGRLEGPPTERTWLGLRFNAREIDNLDHWDVVIQLTDTVRNHWFDGGAAGNDFEIIDSNNIRVTGNGFRMDSIYMYNDELASVNVSFTPKVEPSFLPMKEFYFALSQFRIDYADPDAAFLFLLDNSAGQMSIPPEAMTVSTPEDAGIHWSLVPNPASSSTVVDFSITEEGVVEIEVIDLMGRSARSYSRGYQPGTHRMDVDLNGLSGAVYFVRFSYKGRYAYKRLLIE